MSETCRPEDDARWMTRCLELARLAAHQGEVPVGAVVVRQSVVLGEGQNRVEQRRAATAHAELEAILAAFAAAGEKRLVDAVLYCTLEPCFQCAGAILHARIGRVVFGARDPKFGAVRSLATLLEDPRLNHRCTVIEGVGEQESAALLRTFFRARR